ncbi:unnamed protein product [Thelazia callipaeda]|uniref:Ovule protein n=1 Tax=Thelazia callipaeda TaxID=103827 RepID=A0A0N5CZX3_THECL|nr:unnamed protein product [Thelazia callipaeda]
MDQNETDQISISSSTSRAEQDSRSTVHHRYNPCMNQTNLARNIVLEPPSQVFNSPSVVLSNFASINSNPDIKHRLSSSLSRISTSSCSFRQRLVIWD